MVRQLLLPLLFAAGSTLPIGATSAQSSSVRVAADPNEKVCESQASIGSRLAVKKVCATRAEWKQRHKDEREFAAEIQRGIGSPPCTEALGGARKGMASC